MAGKRAGRPSRIRAAGAGVGARGLEADVERAISALEDLVLAGRADEIPQWTAVLWNRRAEAQRALLRRLEDGPVRVPALFLEVLAGLSGGRAPVMLRGVAANPGVPDPVRLEARRRAGWPARGQARAKAAFLQSLRDPAAALHHLVAQGCERPLPDGETLEEALGYILALPPEQRSEWAARLSGVHGRSAAWLLRALLAAPDARTREAAVAELLRLRDRGAVAALDRLARCAGARGARQAAEAAARRLSLHAAPDIGAGSPSASHPRGGTVPAFERALLTAVDARGAQAVTILRAWSPDARLVIQLLVREEGGIAAVRGSMRVPGEQTQELLRVAGLRDAPLVAVSLDEARASVEWAIERQLAGGRLPPPAYALWEPYLFADLAPQSPARGASAALALIGPAMRPSEECVGALLESPFCAAWQFSVEDLAPVLRDLADGDAAAPSRYAALLGALCPPEARRRLGERLRRQAWVLERSGRADLRDVALGCATHLECAAADELDGLPLLREMLARGLASLRPARRGRDI